ncbi:uncharacterized protein LOC112575146 isoform X2 [Pomacea canaliculata]|uniref:uncharacterized protein LOC112575146 isoform X2 n=1 Tax=Pomacea canaliculata TaxID=400727 RepID=UPI000D73AAC7|nr:uncharacterized protein LOC112575146 isoform X2 [Pomacea canaliculata]
MAIQWLRCGHHVYIVSIGTWSDAACSMLYFLLLQTVKTQLTAGASHGQLHPLQYDFTHDEDVEKAVNDLSQAAMGGSLYVIADEAGPEYGPVSQYQTFCAKLLTRVPRLHLWSASCYHGHAPAGWQVEYLTRPLRSPPAVVREVEQDLAITGTHDVHMYSERGVPVHADGPPVKRVCHRGEGHSNRSGDCVTCCREVARFLRSLHVGATGRCGH